MYVNVTEKQAEELIALAKKNGWRLRNKKPKKVRSLYLSDNNCQLWRYSAQKENSYCGSITEAKQLLLSMKRTVVDGFDVLKSKDGVKIGCTFISNETAKEIVQRISPKTLVVKNIPVIFEEDKVVIGYNGMSHENIMKVAKFAGLINQQKEGE